MIKILIKTLSVLSTVAVFSSVQAKCYPVNKDPNRVPGALIFATSCNTIWSNLKNSGNFPDIFSADPANPYSKLIDGFCFVSAGNVAAVMGNTPVNITSISAWTNEFLPGAFGLGSDNMATVITRWTFRKNVDNKLLGEISTRDAIDFSDISVTPEQDVVIAGTKSLSGAKGAIRVDSHLENVNNVPHVIIDNFSGNICIPGD